MRRFGFLLLLCLTSCVNEVVRTVPSLTIKVYSYDTIYRMPAAPFAYNVVSLLEDDTLPNAWIYVTRSYSDTTEAFRTDENGMFVYSSRVPDTLAEGLYSIRFKALMDQHGSSSTETRWLRVGPFGPPPVASVDIIARGVRPDGSIAAEPVSPTASMHVRTSMPLLPYIYFDANSGTIPERYTRQGSTGFTLQSLAGKTPLDAHHHVLDIIGQRMRENPQADITVTGTNSNAGAERNNATLSRVRAQAVRDYLVNTWGIDAGRVTVEARNLPEIPTNPVILEGMEENRRVELRSNDSRVIGPIKIETRENVQAGETIIRFETTISPTGHPFTMWRITLDQNGTPIGQSLTGSGSPPSAQTMTIPNATSLINQPLRYRLEATDLFGQTFTDEGMTRIVPATVERSMLERFAMMYFDFDRADITEHGREMLELLAESISRDARVVRIDGFTDHTGTDEYNQILSEARANSAFTSIRTMTTLPANHNVEGHGERDPKFDNTLPEGRQLNRRVEFTIEKSKQ